MTRFEQAVREAEYELDTDPESFSAAVSMYDKLMSGTFYDNVPASNMLDPNTHPRGPEYVPEKYPVRETPKMETYEQYRARTLSGY